MEYLRRRIDGLSAWQRGVLAFLLGCLSALAFQPWSLIPVLSVSLIGLLWLVHGCDTPRRAFFIGWLFGIGHFLISMNWIGHAFLVHAAQHAYLAVPAVGGMAAVLALYCATMLWLYRRLVASHAMSVASILMFVSLWTVTEWIRGWAFTGFPWNLVGNIWTVSDAMMQPAAVGGVYFLSLLTVFAFSIPAILGEMSVSRPKRLIVGILYGPIILAIMYGGGQVRLAGADSDFVRDVNLRLVQPNIPQHEKWQSDLRDDHVTNQLSASLTPTPEGAAPTHIIWAETAVPYVLSRQPALVSLLAQAAPENGAIITGAVRSEGPAEDGGRELFWNSLFALGGDSMIFATYDKTHLVPFGEYTPLQDILPLEKLTAGAGNFTPGVGRQSMIVRGLPPFSPLICYEIIFPGEVVPNVGTRPEWILNLTNDAWYGLSAGPYQHYAMARMRAVEEGLPVVRVANTGISGVIDGYGRTLKALDLGKSGYLDQRLPGSLEPTAYARLGNGPAIVLCVLLFVVGMAKTTNSRQ